MKTFIKNYILLLVMVLGQFGCKTTSLDSDTIVSDGWVVNTSFGFNGYRIELPPGYEIYNLRGENEMPKYVKNLATLVQARFKEEPEHENLDCFILHEGKNFIVFELNRETYIRGVFRDIPHLKKRRLLYDSFKDWNGFYKGDAYERAVHGRGERMYAQVSTEGEKYKIDYFCLPGKLNETYIFTGIAEKNEIESVRGAIENMIRSLEN